MLTLTEGSYHMSLHRQLFRILWLTINLQREVILLLESRQSHSMYGVALRLATARSIEDRWLQLEERLVDLVNSEAWPTEDDHGDNDP